MDDTVYGVCVPQCCKYCSKATVDSCLEIIVTANG